MSDFGEFGDSNGPSFYILLNFFTIMPKSGEIKVAANNSTRNLASAREKGTSYADIRLPVNNPYSIAAFADFMAAMSIVSSKPKKIFFAVMELSSIFATLRRQTSNICRWKHEGEIYPLGCCTCNDTAVEFPCDPHVLEASGLVWRLVGDLTVFLSTNY